MISKEEQPEIKIGVALGIGNGLQLFIDQSDEGLFIGKINDNPNNALRLCNVTMPDFVSMLNAITYAFRRLIIHTK